MGMTFLDENLDSNLLRLQRISTTLHTVYNSKCELPELLTTTNYTWIWAFFHQPFSTSHHSLLNFNLQRIGDIPLFPRPSCPFLTMTYLHRFWKWKKYSKTFSFDHSSFSVVVSILRTRTLCNELMLKK